MRFSFKTSLLSLGLAALHFGDLQAQNTQKETKRATGMLTTLASYHTDREQYYNAFNPGLGLCVPLNFKFLKKWNATMDVETGAYYNSIRSITPFGALTFNKKLGKWPVYGGLAFGVFGYQDRAKYKVTHEKHILTAETSIPEPTQNGPVSTSAWRSGRNEYTEEIVDKRARGEGCLRLYPMPIPRICIDILDNKNFVLGTAIQGGWLPGQGGVFGFSTYVLMKN